MRKKNTEIFLGTNPWRNSSSSWKFLLKNKAKVKTDSVTLTPIMTLLTLWNILCKLRKSIQQCQHFSTFVMLNLVITRPACSDRQMQSKRIFEMKRKCQGKCAKGMICIIVLPISFEKKKIKKNCDGPGWDTIDWIHVLKWGLNSNKNSEDIPLTSEVTVNDSHPLLHSILLLELHLDMRFVALKLKLKLKKKIYFFIFFSFSEI